MRVAFLGPAGTFTEEALRAWGGSGGPWPAIASELAAARYDATVLAAGIEDEQGNETRFVWLAPEGAEVRWGPANKTTIVFGGFNDVSPGALVDVLSELSS